MIGKILIGALVVGVGYVAYQAYQKSKTSTPGAQPSNSSIPTNSLTPKFDPGFEGSCMGCLGAPPVRIL